jgi:hypothetical protein
MGATALDARIGLLAPFDVVDLVVENLQTRRASLWAMAQMAAG